MSPRRIRCSVPDCRRTTPGGRFVEWICPRHWRLVRADMRRAWARLRRVDRRTGGLGVSDQRYLRIWRRLKRDAGVV